MNTQGLNTKRLDNTGKSTSLKKALLEVLKFEAIAKEVPMVTIDLAKSMFLLEISFAAKFKTTPKVMEFGMPLIVKDHLKAKVSNLSLLGLNIWHFKISKSGHTENMNANCEPKFLWIPVRSIQQIYDDQ